MPNHVEPRPDKRNVNYTMFEADRIPKDWAIRSAATDLIVVPTESSFRAWVNSGVPEAKLRLCPLGVDGSFFSERAESLVFFDGALWWQPDENVAVEIIQRIIRSDGRTKLLPRDRIIAEYSWPKAGQRLIRVLEELG